MYTNQILPFLFLKLSICNSLCPEFLFLSRKLYSLSKSMIESKYVKQYVTVSDKRSLQKSKMNSQVSQI